jgi:hypothetical protein
MLFVSPSLSLSPEASLRSGAANPQVLSSGNRSDFRQTASDGHFRVNRPKNSRLERIRFRSGRPVGS